jgi:DNA-directed DNA polymerase III PolC
MHHRKTFSLPASVSSSSFSPRSPTLSSTCEYVELLARSNFSFLQGASHPEELVLKAKALGYSGLSLCDVNGMYGVVRGYQAAEKPSAFDAEQLAFTNSDGTSILPFQYICGAELTPFNASPITLIPMNKAGYVKLCRLLTNAKRRAPKGHIVIDFKDILAVNEDLIAIPLPPWKEDQLARLQEAFQDRVYLPVCKDFTWESVRLYQQALKIERELGIELFASQRPLFHDPDRKPLHDVLTCILHKTSLAEADIILSLNRERHLKTREQLAQLYRERPDLLSRTREIASRIQFSLTELRYRYPQENLPAGVTAAEHLRALVEDGIRWRYPAGSQAAEYMTRVRQQAAHEIAIISEMEYEDYFLTLWDLCNFARGRGILHQGRGSAANSIVCFALGLTSIDPIKLNLLFERFISRERGEPPDIDIDFEHERREEVIQYIYGKYGATRAAMVCTVICYRSRMAIREVAKVMGVPLPQIDRLVKFMGREGLSRLVDMMMSPVAATPATAAAGPGALAVLEAGAVASEPKLDLAQLGLDELKFRKLLQLAIDLQGFPRHLGIHSGGFVISQEPIVDIVPVESATMEGRYVIQWNKDDINLLGLMKIDVLSLGMLTAVRKTLDLLSSHKNIHWNLAQIPSEDPATYQMIQKADTVGVFQIESRAQMSLLPRLRPKTFYDLVISVAIVRPGPIQGGMVHPFLRRRAGRERVTYPHPSLAPILNKTMGVPLFQEQIMQIAVAVAGFTPGESDELRRVVSSAWKKAHIMDGLRQRVIGGMLSNGLTREFAEQIYKTIEGFSSYGFPESHAASFALITYASCYLKKHHPDAFVCSLLNSQPMGFYSPRQLISDAQRRGVQFLPLSVQHSDWDFRLEKEQPRSVERLTTSGMKLRSTTHAVAAPHALAHPSFAVRTGLRSVYGLREEQMLALIEERRRGGLFRDLGDLVKRTKLSRVALIRLGAAGALACFGLDTRQVVWTLQGMSFDQNSLFFGSHLGLDTRRSKSETNIIPQESEWEEVRREYQTKGFSIETHPLAVLRPQLLKSARRYTTAKQLETLRDRAPVRVAGLMSLMQKPPTAKGMCFVSLEDETGLLNIVITPDIYQKVRSVLFSSALLEVDGHLESRDGVRNVKAHVVRSLESRLLSGSHS